MNIVVLIKAVPKLKSNITFNHDYTLSRKKALFELNPNDAYAVEEALRIKDKVGAKVTVISLGNNKVKKILKKLMSLGVDECVLVTDELYRGSDTYATALVLSRVIKQMGNVQLIICGKKSSDGSTSQVPIEIAAMLDNDFCTNVCECETDRIGISCVENYENIRIKKYLKYPCVVSVMAEINVPRLPTVDGIIESKNKQISILTNEDLKIYEGNCGISGSLTEVIKTEKKTTGITRKKEIIENYHEIRLSLKENMIQAKNASIKEDEKGQEITLEENCKRNILVFCEVESGEIKRESLDVLSRAAFLASEMPANIVTITTLIDNKTSLIETLSNKGVATNYELSINDIYRNNTRLLGDEIVRVIEKIGPNIVLFASTVKGMALAPYIAAKTKSGLTADCIEIKVEEGKLIQKRPAFGGDVYAVIRSKKSKYDMATVKPFVEEQNYKIKKVNTKNVAVACNMDEEDALVYSKKEVDLDKDIIIGIGKGVGSQKNVDRILDITNKYQYGVCATREVIDKGWMSWDYQVGLTGKVVTPVLYCAIGISGADEHMLGVRKSDKVISVNINTNEPICECSDYIYKINSEEFIDILEMEEM